MSNERHDQSRRRFLRNTLVGAAAIPAATMGFNRHALAQDNRLTEDDPTAQALGYKHDAAEASGNPLFKEGSNCANCALYTDTGGEWGPCAAFGGREVAAAGWCSAWVQG